MKPGIISFFQKIYHNLLFLYPVEFFAEFGPEMETVFSEALTEAQQKGAGPILILFLREMQDLPRSLWREQRRSHQYQRRLIAMTNDIDAAVSGKAGVDCPILVYWFVFLLLPGILGMMRGRTGSPAQRMEAHDHLFAA